MSVRYLRGNESGWVGRARRSHYRGPWRRTAEWQKVQEGDNRQTERHTIRQTHTHTIRPHDGNNPISRHLQRICNYTWELNGEVLLAHFADTLNVTKSVAGLFTADFGAVSSTGFWSQLPAWFEWLTNDVLHEVIVQVSSFLQQSAVQHGPDADLCNFIQELKQFCQWTASTSCIADLNCDATTTSFKFKQEWCGENEVFSSFMHQYLENGTKYDQRYYQWLIGSCISAFD